MKLEGVPQEKRKRERKEPAPWNVLSLWRVVAVAKLVPAPGCGPGKRSNAEGLGNDILPDANCGRKPREREPGIGEPRVTRSVSVGSWGVDAGRTSQTPIPGVPFRTRLHNRHLVHATDESALDALPSSSIEATTARTDRGRQEIW